MGHMQGSRSSIYSQVSSAPCGSIRHLLQDCLPQPHSDHRVCPLAPDPNPYLLPMQQKVGLPPGTPRPGHWPEVTLEAQVAQAAPRRPVAFLAAVGAPAPPQKGGVSPGSESPYPSVPGAFLRQSTWMLWPGVGWWWPQSSWLGRNSPMKGKPWGRNGSQSARRGALCTLEAAAVIRKQFNYVQTITRLITKCDVNTHLQIQRHGSGVVHQEWCSRKGTATEHQNKSQTVTTVGEAESLFLWDKKKQKQRKQKKSEALECFLFLHHGRTAGGRQERQQSGGSEPLTCHICLRPRGPQGQDPTSQQRAPQVHTQPEPCGPQKRGREPWFSNSDQASLSSMKIILAYCSYGCPAALSGCTTRTARR